MHSPTPITFDHYARILASNTEYVEWLSPLGLADLRDLLARATYARQVGEGAGILIGYGHDIDYPDHYNMEWLREKLPAFFYIDRIIIETAAQGKGYGQCLYADVEAYARMQNYPFLACEVNTMPNNPGSHAFHLAMGFIPLGDAAHYCDPSKALRYYHKHL